VSSPLSTQKEVRYSLTCCSFLVDWGAILEVA
jgi:hypothetical protein